MIGTKRLLDGWLPPEGVGEPVTCLATSFAFEPDFFEGQCLSRFLAIQSVRGEDQELVYILEEEERLGEVPVTALVDRSQNPGNRNLRWDLIPIGLRSGGLMHAKLVVLAWERFVRMMVTSANLTRAGYRNQVEACVVLEAFDGSAVPKAVFRDLMGSIREIIGLSFSDPRGAGPVSRALTSADRVEALVDSFGMRDVPKPGAPRLQVVIGGPGRPVLPAIRGMWGGATTPRHSYVLSPFFDSKDGVVSPAATALVAELAKTGARSVDISLPVDQLSETTIIRAPKSISAAMPAGVSLTLRAFAADTPTEPRRLHAKALTLESADWVTALIGSSNFTAAGMGLSGRAHFEVNIAVGASTRSGAGKALTALFPLGEELDIEECRWLEQEDEDEVDVMSLPWGFLDCLVDPDHPPTLLLRLDPEHLPMEWELASPEDLPLLDAIRWREQGSPHEVIVQLPSEALPFWIKVRWQQGRRSFEAGSPTNVTDPSKLPPVDELRALSAQSLLRVLASSRPLHEALALELKTSQYSSSSRPVELDPLRRYSDVGQLLGRARRVSAALDGLRRRLERPAATLESLRWRLTGPVGPVALGRALVRDGEGADFVSGEASFILAELALTLSRTDWDRAGSLLEPRAARRELRAALQVLEEMREELPSEPGLEPYIRAAFKKAHA